MEKSSIERVLESRKPASQPPQADQPQTEEDKFYGVLVGEGVEEHFLELRFRSGMRTCFAYDDLVWFNYDPEGGCLDLEFGGYLVTVKGRGLGEALFNGIRRKRTAWVKEADVEMQDHPGNKVFIQEITITPPSSGESEAGNEGEQTDKK